jgi:hypothetical protein
MSPAGSRARVQLASSVEASAPVLSPGLPEWRGATRRCVERDEEVRQVRVPVEIGSPSSRPQVGAVTGRHPWCDATFWSHAAGPGDARRSSAAPGRARRWSRSGTSSRVSPNVHQAPTLVTSSLRRYARAGVVAATAASADRGHATAAGAASPAAGAGRAAGDVAPLAVDLPVRSMSSSCLRGRRPSLGLSISTPPVRSAKWNSDSTRRSPAGSRQQVAAADQVEPGNGAS